MENKEYKDYSGAIFLISIGVMFLLNTTNIIPWGIWIYILRFWPILLVLAGIKMILPKHIITNIVMSIIYLVVFAFVGISSYLYMSEKQLSPFTNTVTNCLFDSCELTETTEVQTESIPLASYPQVTTRDLDFTVAASSLTLQDSDTEDYVVTQMSGYPTKYIPEMSSSLSEGVLSIDFDSNRLGNWNWLDLGSPTSTVTIGQILIPTDITIELGAGDIYATFDQLAIGELYAHIGAGDTEISLTDNAIPQSIKADVGAGSLTLKLPSDVGISLTYNVGVGEISFDDEGFGEDKVDWIGQDGTRTSSNYDSSTKKIDIEATVGVGQLTIERI